MPGQPATNTNRRRPANERRRWARVPAADLPNVTAELTSGTKVLLVDVSLGGARFRTRTRMLPGLAVTLRFVAPEGTSVVRGQIVRSAFVNMDEGPPGYEVSVAFDQILSGPIADAPALAEQALQAEPGQTTEPDEPVKLEVTAEVNTLINKLVD